MIYVGDRDDIRGVGCCDWVVTKRQAAAKWGDINDIRCVIDIELDIRRAGKVLSADQARPVIQLPAHPNKSLLIGVDPCPAANLLGQAISKANIIGVEPTTAVCVVG